MSGETSHESSRRQMLNSLSIELDEICARTASASASSSRLPGSSQLVNDHYGDAPVLRITANKSPASRNRAVEPQQLGKLEEGLASASKRDIIETPISPSIAFAAMEGSSLPTYKSTAGDQNKLCFDVSDAAVEGLSLPAALCWESGSAPVDWRGQCKDKSRLGQDSGYSIQDLNANTCNAAQQPGITDSAMEDSSGVSSFAEISEGIQPTHRVTHSFHPRHGDELLLELGDPIYVEAEMEDHWCLGTNLRTSKQGIFPIAHVFEIDFEEECGSMRSLVLKLEDRAIFYVTMLGSVEVAYHKGNDVLVQAINKVLNVYQNRSEVVAPSSVLLDISFRGIHIIDKSRRNFFRCPNFDYFYSLQNISYCGAHPKQLRYFGFITKHPLLPRFACNVFLSNGSTQPIVDAIGRAFRRSYDEYMAFTHPTEDIFID